MNSRVTHWLVFLVSGGFGWYQNLVALGWADQVIPQWLAVLLFFAAIGGGAWAFNHVGMQVEEVALRWMEGRWKGLHYRALEKKKGLVLKWILAPLLVWFLPLLFGLIGLGANRYE